VCRLKTLLANNRRWAEAHKARDPDFFNRLTRQQEPDYFWIGCSDSRVPATDIVDLDPGEIFVHRNIANMVHHTDMNLLSVLEFAVENLQVKHIIVCGHYGCGGVQAALSRRHIGIVDNWLYDIKFVYEEHRQELDALDERARLDRLCELNVRQQTINVCHTTVVQEAWKRGRELAVHGWIYSIQDGLLRDLDICLTGLDQLDDAYRVF